MSLSLTPQRPAALLARLFLALAALLVRVARTDGFREPNSCLRRIRRFRGASAAR